MDYNVRFSDAFYEDLENIMVFSSAFFRGDESLVARFIAELVLEIAQTVSNRFVSGVSDQSCGVEMRSVLIRKLFRIYFIEENGVRSIVRLRSTRSIT